VNKQLQAACHANGAGLDRFAAGDPAGAETFLRQAYRLYPEEPALLVNLGLALMQQGRHELAERCYRLALGSDNLRHRRSAAKNLGFLYLWLGDFQQGWYWHGQRFAAESFLANQWAGQPLNGTCLTVWNDVGMGDAFQFVRYTLPLVQRGEKIRLAVAASQVELFQRHLAWPLVEVVDRNRIDRHAGVHIPLMNLIALLDPDTSWGRGFKDPTWCLPPTLDCDSALGLCWASNPADRTMHAYKSTSPEALVQRSGETGLALSLQANEADAHRRLGLKPAPQGWIDTLERLTRCRCVLSVDTAVAHLAGGAGLPVRLWLGAIPDWRWRQFPAQGTALSQLWYPQLDLLPQLTAP